MTAIRNDLANATEQTVLALKELETRIGVLKNDLAWLCQGIGHPEAARVAASSVPNLMAPAGFGPAFAPGFQAGYPLQAVQGFQASPGFPTQANLASPFGIPTQAIGAMGTGAPVAAPFGTAAAFAHPAYTSLAYQQAFAQAVPQAFAAYASPFATASPAYMARQPSFAYDSSLAYR